MPNTLCHCALALLALVLSGVDAKAVVLSGDYEAEPGLTIDETSVAFGLASEFDGVVALYNSGRLCTGVLISPTAVLTARHCTDGRIDTAWNAFFGTSITGFSSISVESVTTLTPNASSPKSYFNGTDLAVLTLSRAADGAQPYEILTNAEYAETVAILGYGRTGDGETGYTSEIDYNRRFATNAFEVAETQSNGNRILFADFDSGDPDDNTLAQIYGTSSPVATLYEGLIGGGDSGGPLMFWRDGQWVVGGIATGVRAYDGDADADYGDLGVWTAIYSQEAIDLVAAAGATLYSVDTTVVAAPLPQTIWALGAAVLSMQVLRRKSRAG